MAYRFDPHRTLDRLEDLLARVREAIASHKAGKITAAESAARRVFGEAGELFDKEKTLNQALRSIEAALAAELGTDFFYVVEWGTDYLIYEMETGQKFRREFKLKQVEDGFDVTLKSAVEVEQIWQAVSKTKQKRESVATPAATKLLEEAATEAVSPALFSEAGRATIKLIQPGQGSSGFYSERVLQRDGPQAFPAGTHMYLDHPTVSEEFERPERSLETLAAKLTSQAEWQASGPAGPGLYAEAEIADEYRPRLKQFADVTGVSIRAMGEMDGDGNVTKLLPNALNSVDFVTVPGAGGKIVELIESARGTQKPPEVKEVDKTEVQALVAEALKGQAEEVTALREQNAKLQQTVIRESAKAEATRILEAVPDMHASAKAEVVRNVSQNPPVANGELDTVKFAEAVDAETKRVAKLVESLTGTRPAVTGAGEATTVGSIDDAEKDLEAAFREAGMTDETAKHFKAGRVQ